MFELDCKICYVSFDNTLHLPRMLHCGHTYCTSCIHNLFENMKSCPSCRMAIASTSIQEIPVNYMVLDLVDCKDDIFSSRESFVENYLKDLIKLKDDYIHLKATMTTEKDSLDKNLFVVETNMETLESLMVINDPFDKKSREALKILQEQFSSIRSQMISSGVILRNDISVLSSNYDSYEEYLAEIYNGILCDKRYVSVLQIGGAIKFSKLSVRDNFIFIHAFEEHKGNDTAITVCFKDLISKLLREKNDADQEFQESTVSLTSLHQVSGAGIHIPVSRRGRLRNLHPMAYLRDCRGGDYTAQKFPLIYGFLDLTYGPEGLCRRILVEVSKSATNLGSTFLKICTGEAGVSYKGHTYEQSLEDTFALNNQMFTGIEKIVLLKDFGWGLDEENSIARYFLLNNDTRILCQGGTYYLKFLADGSFEIFKHSQGNLAIPNIVGPVIDFHNNIHSTLLGAQNRKILDCGIAIKM